jgi:hypothetical protein
MKKLFAKIVVYSLMPVCLLFLMDRRLDKNIQDHYELQYKEIFSPQVRADTVIFGASSACHGINPYYLEDGGSRVYNFAYDGASPSFLLKWYNQVFRRYYSKPKLIILGVSWFIFDDTILWRTFEHDSEYWPLNLFIRELFDLSNRADTLVFNRFFSLKEKRKFEYLVRKKPDDLAFAMEKFYKGYLPIKGVVSPGSKPIIEGRIFDRQVNDLKALLRQIKKDRIKLVLVCLPDFIPGREATNFKESICMLEQVAEENQVPLLNYNAEEFSYINGSGRFFSNWSHLNEAGNIEFIKLFKSDLQKLRKR